LHPPPYAGRLEHFKTELAVGCAIRVWLTHRGDFDERRSRQMLDWSFPSIRLIQRLAWNKSQNPQSSAEISVVEVIGRKRSLLRLVLFS
jgi:hypothetical protein